MTRPVRGVGVALAAGALCLSAAACGDAVSGKAVAVQDSAPSHVSAKLTELMVDPAKFPPQYQALVLPPQAASQASSDLTGVAAGAKVDPAGCKPPTQKFGPDDTAIAVGTDNGTRATISVELIRTTQRLSVRRDQVQNCDKVEVTRNGNTSVLHSELQPAPPVDADDSFAVKQTVESGSGSEKLKQSMLTLVAQVGDVRVSATYMSFGAAKPDTAVLDSLFTDAVSKVKDA